MKNTLFVEELDKPEDIKGLRKYRTFTKLKVALGERIITKNQALEFMKEGLVDYLQIDLCCWDYKYI